MKGSTFKRCSCPPLFDAKGRRANCPKRHGSWYFAADAPAGPGGARRLVRRGGYPTQKAAQEALSEVAAAVATGTFVIDARTTVGAWLEEWLQGKVRGGLRPTTARSYRQHVDAYLGPHLGHLRLRDLRATHVEGLLRAVGEGGGGRGRPPGPATVRRIHATLRSALSTAKRKRLVAFNAAQDVDLPRASRPRVRPWEPGELGAFLDHAGTDPRHGTLFELIAATGLRRGEACGLRWADVDLERGHLVVRQQVVVLGHELAFGPPKTASGEHRVVDLDERTVGALLAHRLAQDAERAAWADAYAGHGLVFAREDGSPLHPERVTRRFRQLAAEAGLRPIRLHDLRHGQASLMLAAGVPIAIVSKRLGHSSITITSDTYSHLLEGVGRQAAEAAAALVPRAVRPRTQNVPSGGESGPRDDPAHLPGGAKAQVRGL